MLDFYHEKIYGVQPMKLKLTIAAFAISLATIVATEKATKKVEAPTISKQQADQMEQIVNDILAGAKGVSGPNDIFRFVNGQQQINADQRETTLSGAITSAKEAKCSIICFQNGEIVAASDPTLIGKKNDALLKLVVDELKKSPNDRALITYEKREGRISDKEAIYALGRNSFTYSDGYDAKSGPKYVLIMIAPIAS